MAEHPRIEELRRRVQKDKASIAFAQLAEEDRRAGRFDEAIETCRTGLAHHPGYLSAHVTLGRALIEVGQLPQAQEELQRVLAAAPENLAALKGLAEIRYRRGEPQEALALYRRALELAPHDPDLEHLVAQISRELEPAGHPSEVPGGLSFAEAMGEFLALDEQAAGTPLAAEPVPVVPEQPAASVTPAPTPPGPAPAPADTHAPGDSEERPRAVMQVEALERWLDAILADRQHRS